MVFSLNIEVDEEVILVTSSGFVGLLVLQVLSLVVSFWYKRLVVFYSFFLAVVLSNATLLFEYLKLNCFNQIN